MNRLTTALLGIVCLSLLGTAPQAAPSASVSSVIVQASDARTAGALVAAVGATVTHELGVINAVAARLTVAQQAQLRAGKAGVRLFEENSVEVAKKTDKTDKTDKWSTEDVDVRDGLVPRH